MRLGPLILGLVLLSLTASLGCCGRTHSYRCSEPPCNNCHLPATTVPVTAGCCPA
jgi:hypothetical protein